MRLARLRHELIAFVLLCAERYRRDDHDCNERRSRDIVLLCMSKLRSASFSCGLSGGGSAACHHSLRRHAMVKPRAKSLLRT